MKIDRFLWKVHHYLKRLMGWVIDQEDFFIVEELEKKSLSMKVITLNVDEELIKI